MTLDPSKIYRFIGEEGDVFDQQKVSVELLDDSDSEFKGSEGWYKIVLLIEPDEDEPFYGIAHEDELTDAE